MNFLMLHGILEEFNRWLPICARMQRRREARGMVREEETANRLLISKTLSDWSGDRTERRCQVTRVYLDKSTDH